MAIAGLRSFYRYRKGPASPTAPVLMSGFVQSL